MNQIHIIELQLYNNFYFHGILWFLGYSTVHISPIYSFNFLSTFFFLQVLNNNNKSTNYSIEIKKNKHYVYLYIVWYVKKRVNLENSIISICLYPSFESTYNENYSSGRCKCLCVFNVFGIEYWKLKLTARHKFSTYIQVERKNEWHTLTHIRTHMEKMPAKCFHVRTCHVN